MFARRPTQFSAMLRSWRMTENDMTENDKDFASLGLSPGLHQGVEAAGYTQMTPIQAESLPAVLAGRDVIAQAPTGSGKTAAFGLAFCTGSTA